MPHKLEGRPITSAWLSALVEGHAADTELEALRRLARELEVSEALFVSRAVEHLIKLESSSETAAAL